MARVRVSVGAEQDLDRIATYTASSWGWKQTSDYLAKVEDSFELIGRSPSIGRSCDSVRTGLRRLEVGKHVVFYLIEPEDVLIVRVLHQQMLPANYM